MMSLTIQLTPEMEQQLRERAAQVGRQPEELVIQLVADGLTFSLDDDLKRFRSAILSTGETEDESGVFFQSIVEEVRSN